MHCFPTNFNILHLTRHIIPEANVIELNVYYCDKNMLVIECDKTIILATTEC